MQINLKNVGIIEDSSILLEGITLITGKNNSGKTTVGKAIYSIISSYENLYNSATEDILDYAKNILSSSLRNSELNFLCRGTKFTEKVSAEYTDSVILELRKIYNYKYPQFTSLSEMIEFIDFIINEIKEWDKDQIINYLNSNITVFKFKNEQIILKFDDIINSFIDECEDVKNKIDKYSDFVEYERVKQLFITIKEFDNQVYPVKKETSEDSIISIEDNNKKYSFVLDEHKHTFSTNGESIFNDNSNVVFIDDVTILDSISPGLSTKKHLNFNSEFESYISCYDHKMALIKKLSDALSSQIKPNNDFLNSVIEKINYAFSDDIIEKDGQYVCSSDGLNISNLAMGSKLFAILKILFSKNKINKDTVLILDEPEAHLHPEWQNILAEIIAILVKEFNAKVIITTHSPLFVLAVQTYSMLYKLSDKTNFYITSKKEGYLVNYIKTNESLNKNYSDFAKYFSQIRALYNKSCEGGSDDTV